MAGEKLTNLGYTKDLLDGKAPSEPQQPARTAGEGERSRKAFIAGLPPAESDSKAK